MRKIYLVVIMATLLALMVGTACAPGFRMKTDTEITVPPQPSGERILIARR